VCACLQEVDLTQFCAADVAYVPRSPGKKAKVFISGMIELADKLSQIPVPENGRDWEKALRKRCGKKNPTAFLDYSKKWHLRSRFFLRRLAISDKPLDVEGMSLARFSNLFPDSGAWVKRLCPRDARSLEGLFTTCHYKADPLLFTMYACLFADRALHNVTGQQVSKMHTTMKRAVVQYYKKHGQNPHPAVLWQQVAG